MKTLKRKLTLEHRINLSKSHIGKNIGTLENRFGKEKADMIKSKKRESMKRLFKEGKLIAYWKGKKLNPEAIKKMVETRKKNPNYGKVLCGRKSSEKTRNRLRENAKVNPNYGMKGKHHSKETIRKIKEKRARQIFSEESKIKRGKSIQEGWSKLSLEEKRARLTNAREHSPFKKGHKVKLEWIEAVKKAKIGKPSWNKGKILSKEEYPNMGVRAFRDKIILPTKDTSIEIKIQNYLKQLGIEFYTHQYIKEIEHSYQCDILIPVQEGIVKKTIIECFGTYWHNYPYGNEKDKFRTQELLGQGYRVLVFWENEIKAMEVNDLRNKLI